MSRVLALLFIAFIFVSFFVHSAQAVLSPEAQACLIAGPDTNYGGMNCDGYLDDTTACLSSLPTTNSVWKCADTNNNGTIETTTELKQCSETYARDVCGNLGGLTLRSCKTMCASYRTQALINQYLYKYNSSVGTPTPTPRPGSVIEQDVCTRQIDVTGDCAKNMSLLHQCYKNVPPESGLFSCVDATGNPVAPDLCIAAFSTRVKNNLQEKISDRCMGNYSDPATGGYVSHFLLENDFREKLSERANPSITPTPGIIDEVPTPTLPPSGAGDAYTVLNCGFANADDTAKQRCCDTTMSKQEFTSPTDFQECSWYDVSCHLNQNIQSYFTERANENLENTRQDFNNILNENGGVLPKCFVGTCEERYGETKCWPDTGSKICERYITEENAKAASACDSCMRLNIDYGKSYKFYTALGCIDTSFEGIVGQVFSIGIGLAGMIALGCIIYSAFIMQTSMGNPEQLQKAQENVTSCITGLILIILSIFILRILGVDILRIPGFGG